MMLQSDELLKLSEECETILKTKQIIKEFCKDTLNQYNNINTDNPLFLLPEKLQSLESALDTLYIIKYAQLKKLN